MDLFEQKLFFSLNVFLTSIDAVKLDPLYLVTDEVHLVISIQESLPAADDANLTCINHLRVEGATCKVTSSTEDE